MKITFNPNHLKLQTLNKKSLDNFMRPFKFPFFTYKKPHLFVKTLKKLILNFKTRFIGFEFILIQLKDFRWFFEKVFIWNIYDKKRLR